MPNTRKQNKKRNSKVVAVPDSTTKHGRLFAAALNLFQYDTLAKFEFYP